MKLTNAIKDSIVRAVMGATPCEYSSDQRDKDALLVCVSKMPEKVRKFWDNKETRPWVKTEYESGFNYLPTGGQKIPELQAISARYEASEKARSELRSHVRNVVYQFSTDKQMRELVPELDAYIPKPAVKTKQLPVTTALIAELTKAGFPNGK